MRYNGSNHSFCCRQARSRARPFRRRQCLHGKLCLSPGRRSQASVLLLLLQQMLPTASVRLSLGSTLGDLLLYLPLVQVALLLWLPLMMPLLRPVMLESLLLQLPLVRVTLPLWWRQWPMLVAIPLELQLMLKGLLLWLDLILGALSL